MAVPFATRLDAFDAAARLGWIPDDTTWIRMLEDRNLSSHVYDEEAATTIYRALPAYLAALNGLRVALRERIRPA